MKFIILALALFCFASAQNPIPVPYANLTNFQGLWYVVWEYDDDINTQTNPIRTKCMTLNISTENTVGDIELTIQRQYDVEHSDLPFNVINNGNTVWEISDEVFDWIAIDPISFSWGVVAAENVQNAFIVSRAGNLTNLVLNAQILLLQAEGYAVNATNQVQFNTSLCQ